MPAQPGNIHPRRALLGDRGDGEVAVGQTSATAGEGGQPGNGDGVGAAEEPDTVQSEEPKPSSSATSADLTAEFAAPYAMVAVVNPP